MIFYTILKNTFHFLVITCFFSFSFHAQMNKKALDSLSTRQKDSIKIKQLLKSSFKNVFSNLPLSKEYVDKALYLSKTKKFKQFFVESHNIKGIYFAISGVEDSCAFYFKKSLELSKKNSFKVLEAKSLNSLGMYYKNNGNFSKAQEYFFESLALCEKIDKSPVSPISNIGLIYQIMKQFDKAIEFHDRAISLRTKDNDISGVAISLNNLGICYKGLERYNEAITTFLKCIENAKKSDNLNTLYKAYENLGNTYYLKKDYIKAINYYKLCIKRDEDFPISSKEKMVLYENFSRTLIAQKKYKEALWYAKEAKEILDNNKDYRFYAEETYHSLAICYFFLGDVEKGIAYNDEYYELIKHNFNSENKKIVNELETKYETEKKERALLQTKAEKAITELNLAKQKQLSYGLFVGLAMLLLIGFSVFQRNKRKHQLAISQEKENNLKSIITAEEKERNRIARELHDGIVQQIAAVIINSRNNLSKLGLEEKPESKELISQLENSNKELRTISHQMMPRALEEKGLITALEELLNKSLQPVQITYDFEHVNITERLPKRIEVTLYRITQELINNIIKHSKANHVNVQLMKTETAIVFMVEDNGKGFSKTSKKGIGLQNIKSRIDMIKGSVNFNSENTGTLTTIKIPL